MAASNRAALIAKTQKVLKRHFKPVPAIKRNVFEHLVFACCLENSPHRESEATFAALETQFFDWNEVRVSTVRELAETMNALYDPEDAAIRLTRVLQGIFETFYSFDLESFLKENIGQAVARIEQTDGTTPFVVAYATQQALGGHAIPVNRGLMESFRIIGVVSDAEAAKGNVPGLERAIPKSQGIEYGSIFHNLGVSLSKNPFSPTVRKLLLEIAPGCKDRLPKRTAKPAAAKETKAAAAKKKPAKPAAGSAAAKKKSAKQAKTAKKAAVETPSAEVAARKSVTTKATAKKKMPKKTTSKKKSTIQRLSKKKPK